MANIIIAANNHPSDKLHDFFQACYDKVRQQCVDNNHEYYPLTPPELTNENLLKVLQKHHLVFIAAHGDSDGIENELKEYFLSAYTINYDFKDKAVYTVSCHSGSNLKDALLRIGTKLFVGYKSTLKIGSDKDSFTACAISGLNKILEGRCFAEAKQYMLDTYDQEIDSVGNMDQLLLLHNREQLVFEGDMNGKI